MRKIMVVLLLYLTISSAFVSLNSKSVKIKNVNTGKFLSIDLAGKKRNPDAIFLPEDRPGQTFELTTEGEGDEAFNYLLYKEDDKKTYILSTRRSQKLVEPGEEKEKKWAKQEKKKVETAFWIRGKKPITRYRRFKLEEVRLENKDEKDKDKDLYLILSSKPKAYLKPKTYLTKVPKAPKEVEEKIFFIPDEAAVKNKEEIKARQEFQFSIIPEG